VLLFIMAQPFELSARDFGFIAGTAILWPAIGWLAGYLLGRNSGAAVALVELGLEAKGK
jgi:hypothetical protein